MTAIALDAPKARRKPTASGVLDAAAKTWFGAAVIGQALFLYYIVAFYGPSTLTGNFQAWSLNKMLIRGYVPGDTPGNLAFAAHVMMAAVITFGGTVQLVPQIRARWPAVHRWTGRAFLTTAMAASLAGLYMTWARHTGNAVGSTAISIDAALILLFSTLAWRTARARDFASHRRWAMRAFLVANGVWFLRVGLAPFAMAVKLLHGPRELIGTFFEIWNFGAYLVPLALLELYFRARQRGGPRGKVAMAGGLYLATALMSVGIVGAWFGFFAPVLAKA